MINIGIKPMCKTFIEIYIQMLTKKGIIKINNKVYSKIQLFNLFKSNKTFISKTFTQIL